MKWHNPFNLIDFIKEKPDNIESIDLQFDHHQVA
jgi:hypothetical protein